MATRAPAQGEVLDRAERDHSDAEARKPPELGEDLRVTCERYVDVALPERREHVLRRRNSARTAEAEDDPVEVGGMRPPVARVPDERHLPPTLVVLKEERTTPDRRTGPGIFDPVPPYLFQVATSERVRGQDAGEQCPPSGRPFPHDDPHAL